MSERKVYAHYMVGITSGQTSDQWTNDINDAKSVGIDGFALNIGPSDSYTLEQMRLAFAAAESVGGFTLFPSFDMAVGEWGVQTVIDIINEFKSSSAHATRNGSPLISTFEGPGWSGNWATVRSGTGGIYLVPDWSSLGPDGVAGKLDQIDGHFSWNAWPGPGSKNLTSVEDERYIEILGDKSYMMGISPWFYTNLPQYSKNWFSTGDSLWYDRWQQAIDLLPDMIEIITWNDFGESSYISDIVGKQIVSGANAYVEGYDHSAFRAVLPYFTAAYKAGNRAISPSNGEQAIAWYRTTRASLGGDGGTVWGQGGSQSASLGTSDTVNVLTITVDEQDIQVAIGGSSQTFRTGSGGQPANFVQVPFGELTGAVSLTLGDRSVVGPSITNNLPSTGYVNFNALAIAL
ncbi:unnamed protein product [Clonostachys rhizophaga]|uniref:Glycoside hydrolase family 71 protein n=1 Tax=Clonostachys rhizophaga TaxID=160324 RepID=A0A9N9YWZ9_9HYPO|nr:unnamed protein product [Clonostachys rhizophaga]